MSDSDADLSPARGNTAHGPARHLTDCWSVNVSSSSVLIRRGSPGHGEAESRPVVLTLTIEDAHALAEAILRMTDDGSPDGR